MRQVLGLSVLSTLIAAPFFVNAEESLRSSTEFQPIVLAQAGSTGGTIGKENRSVTGSEERRELYRPDTALAGRWRWRSVCGTLKWSGEFEISQSSAHSFSGAFLSDGPGTISSGNISGKQVSFTRRTSMVTQHWNGTLDSSGKSLRLHGSHTEPILGGYCQFTATKD
jgi:hypothetical protein